MLAPRTLERSHKAHHWWQSNVIGPFEQGLSEPHMYSTMVRVVTKCCMSYWIPICHAVLHSMLHSQ